MQYIDYLKSNIQDSKWNYLFDNNWNLDINPKLLSNDKIWVQLIINYWWIEEWYIKVMDRLDILRKEVYETWFLYSEDNFRTNSFDEFDNHKEIILNFFVKTKKFIDYFSNFLPKENISIWNSINLNDMLTLVDNLFYDSKKFIFYDSKKNVVFDILNKRSWWAKKLDKPEFYDIIIIILFMYLYENRTTENKHIYIWIENNFKEWLNYINNIETFKAYDIDINKYWNYFSNEKKNKIENLKKMLEKNLKSKIFRTYSNWIIVW